MDLLPRIDRGAPSRPANMAREPVRGPLQPEAPTVHGDSVHTEMETGLTFGTSGVIAERPGMKRLGQDRPIDVLYGGVSPVVLQHRVRRASGIFSRRAVGGVIEELMVGYLTDGIGNIEIDGDGFPITDVWYCNDRQLTRLRLRDRGLIPDYPLRAAWGLSGRVFVLQTHDPAHPEDQNIVDSRRYYVIRLAPSVQGDRILGRRSPTPQLLRVDVLDDPITIAEITSSVDLDGALVAPITSAGAGSSHDVTATITQDATADLVAYPSAPDATIPVTAERAELSPDLHVLFWVSFRVSPGIARADCFAPIIEFYFDAGGVPADQHWVVYDGASQWNPLCLFASSVQAIGLETDGVLHRALLDITDQRVLFSTCPPTASWSLTGSFRALYSAPSEAGSPGRILGGASVGADLTAGSTTVIGSGLVAGDVVFIFSIDQSAGEEHEYVRVASVEDIGGGLQSVTLVRPLQFTHPSHGSSPYFYAAEIDLLRTSGVTNGEEYLVSADGPGFFGFTLDPDPGESYPFSGTANLGECGALDLSVPGDLIAENLASALEIDTGLGMMSTTEELFCSNFGPTPIRNPQPAPPYTPDLRVRSFLLLQKTNPFNPPGGPVGFSEYISGRVTFAATSDIQILDARIVLWPRASETTRSRLLLVVRRTADISPRTDYVNFETSDSPIVKSYEYGVFLVTGRGERIAIVDPWGPDAIRLLDVSERHVLWQRYDVEAPFDLTRTRSFLGLFGAGNTVATIQVGQNNPTAQSTITALVLPRPDFAYEADLFPAGEYFVKAWKPNSGLPILQIPPSGLLPKDPLLAPFGRLHSLGIRFDFESPTGIFTSEHMYPITIAYRGVNDRRFLTGKVAPSLE